MPRFNCLGWSLAGVLALFAITAPAQAQDAAQEMEQVTDAIIERELRETRAVLRTLIANDIENLQPCDLSDKWQSDMRIRAEDAQRFFGVKLRAELSAPDDGRTVTEILEPDEAMARNFCDDDALQTQRAQLMADFGAGRVVGDPPSIGRSERHLRLQRIMFGRPVFDPDFRTAVIVVGSQRIEWSRDPEDAIKHPDWYRPNGIRKSPRFYVHVTRYVYRKHGAEWVKIADDVTFSGE